MMTTLALGQVLAQAHSAANTPPTVDFHIGQIISWDSDTATNRVRVLGTIMNNLPVLTSAGSVGLENGIAVGILKVRTQYFILGRIVDQSTGLVNPQFPIVLYPQFITANALGTSGAWNVNSGVLVSWEGRIKVTFPYIEVDGIWGNLSGVGSTTYALLLGGVSIGTWTETTLTVARRGPFDVTDYMGQDWLKIELAITASSGAGVKAVQPLACYFRDTQ